MERRGHPRMEIKDAQSFSDVCCDMLDEFMEDFPTRKGLTRDIEECDPFEKDEVGFMYTQSGMYLHNTYIKRMVDLGKKHFDERDINITSIHMIFP